LNAYERIAASWGLDINESAVLLGVSKRTAYRWLKENFRERAGGPKHSRAHLASG